jgi:hypothetical protein
MRTEKSIATCNAINDADIGQQSLTAAFLP